MSEEWLDIGSGDTGDAAIRDARTTLAAQGREVPDDEFIVRHYTTDTGSRWKASVRVTPEETLADRLTLVSEVGWLYFDPPVFVQPGEAYWTWGRTLHVRAANGEVRQVQARPGRADDRR